MADLLYVNDRNQRTRAPKEASRTARLRVLHVIFTCEGKWWMALQPAGRKSAGRWGATAATFYREGETLDAALERVCLDELKYQVFVNEQGIYARDPFFRYEGTLRRDGDTPAFIDVMTRDIDSSYVPKIGRPDQTEQFELWAPRLILDRPDILPSTATLRRIAALLLQG